MNTLPVMTSSEPRISASVLCIRASISSARFRRIIPSSVSTTFREPFTPRMSSCLPSSSSKAFSWVDSAGWEMCKVSAAAVMFCSLATVRKYSKTRNSMGIVPLFCQYIEKFHLCQQ